MWYGPPPQNIKGNKHLQLAITLALQWLTEPALLQSTAEF